MSIPHHQSAHLDDEIGFWIVAHVHKLDSHANWSAEWHSRRSDTGEINTGWLFLNYECDADILREFVSRGIVTRCVNAVTEHVFDDLLLELNEERHPASRAPPLISNVRFQSARLSSKSLAPLLLWPICSSH